VSVTAILIAGPTASGKSALAAVLAQRHGGVVINADSMQIYRDLPVLSAQPHLDADGYDPAHVPHRLYGVLDGAELCSAARWHALAALEVTRARDLGLLPIFVGGTGLYLRTLIEGLAPVPGIPQAIRDEVRAEMAACGPEAMHRALDAIDPAMAQKLETADSQRIARAFEVIRATGQSLLAFQSRRLPGCLSADHEQQTLALAALDLPRDVLYARCDMRFHDMLDQGALDEVQALLARRLDPALPVMKALGVPPLGDYLAGTIDLPEAIALAQKQTRHYAKRQQTWIRTQFSHWPMIDAGQPEAALQSLEAQMAVMAKTPLNE
jgi:tRNA dimethylallyltransferase